jgi:hypothetical protein
MKFVNIIGGSLRAKSRLTCEGEVGGGRGFLSCQV